MASSFYVRILGEQRGPIGVTELRRIAANGQLLPSDQVSRNGREWTVAREVKGLDFPKNGMADSSTTPMPDGYSSVNPSDFDPSEVLGKPIDTAAAVQSPPIPESPKSPSKQSPLNLAACPDCRELVSKRAIACPKCGCPICESRPNDLGLSLTEIKAKRSYGNVFLGTLGILGMVYYFLFFDTTTPAQDGSYRIHHERLLNDRIVGTILCSILLVRSLMPRSMIFEKRSDTPMWQLIALAFLIVGFLALLAYVVSGDESIRPL